MSEQIRLEQDASREKNWKRWGPYLSERQWGTVREDYSPDGTCWDSFSHEQSRSRAYRWGEDGLLGFTDRECRLCFSVALWNGHDPILKERLFGLTGPEGNHGEDVKECYYYLDSTPTHSYAKALYKYPQNGYPYDQIVGENRRRGKSDPEFELVDTGVFNDGRYFDVSMEYAKAGPDDILMILSVTNRGPESATVHVLPQFLFRNTWSWGCKHEGCWAKPRLMLQDDGSVLADHPTLGKFRCYADAVGKAKPEPLFTENETNSQRLFNAPNAGPFVKDAFHDYIVNGKKEAVNPRGFGTKMAFAYKLDVPAGKTVQVRLRLCAEEDAPKTPFAGFDETFMLRMSEAEDHYAAHIPAHLSVDEKRVVRQAYAGLLWSKQFYHYIVKDWLEGDPDQPTPPASRWQGRNADWQHLFNRDVLSMPDKWEYPWYAAWDLAFHMIPFAKIDPTFTKEQLVLFLREWYMHPNGQLPAYEFAFGDVNPPVHAWACWRVYKMTAPRGQRDRVFLSRVFQKLLINFTWWVNRKDVKGKHLFSGGFLGLDNIGVFDRSKPLPSGHQLEQADGTAWMAFYCLTMLSISLELAKDNPATEDIASKFFEHFISIVDAMNSIGGGGLWDEEDGFYYDQLHADGQSQRLRVRSLVGLIPLIAVEVLDQDVIDKLPGFKKRLQWFLENRQELAANISYMDRDGDGKHGHRLLAIPSRERLERVLKRMFDENEFLSPHGLRSVSKYHHDHPFVLNMDGQEQRVDYVPAESNTGLFGGNSNWRGPIWFPINYLLIEALERYHHYYGNSLMVEFPTGSGNRVNLSEAARLLAQRLNSIFLADKAGKRPVHGSDARYANDPAWKDLVLFYEYFDGDNGRGVGASHQTGWTALVARCIENFERMRPKK